MLLASLLAFQPSYMCLRFDPLVCTYDDDKKRIT